MGVPVVLSSLEQIPLVRRMLGPKPKIGVFSDAAYLTPALFRASGVEDISDIVISNSTAMSATQKQFDTGGINPHEYGQQLVALAEVETALAGFVLSARERDILTVGVRAGTEAVRLATLQYSAGTLDFLTVLTAHQQVLTLQDELVQAQGLSAETLVEVYRALGGGWTPGVVPPEPDSESEAPSTTAATGKESA